MSQHHWKRKIRKKNESRRTTAELEQQADGNMCQKGNGRQQRRSGSECVGSLKRMGEGPTKLKRRSKVQGNTTGQYLQAIRPHNYDKYRNKYGQGDSASATKRRRIQGAADSFAATFDERVSERHGFLVTGGRGVLVAACWLVEAAQRGVSFFLFAGKWSTRFQGDGRIQRCVGA